MIWEIKILDWIAGATELIGSWCIDEWEIGLI
jgi:hypothetical protein